MSTSGESIRPQGPIKGGAAAARSFGRAANWAIGAAAAVLVLISVGGYFYHREQLSAIAAEHLRLIVTGPANLQTGAAAEFTVSTTAIGGQPLPAQIEVALLGPDGKRLKGYQEPADERGRLQIVIPAELSLPLQTRLKVIARHGESQEGMEMPLRVKPVGYATQLTLDRSLYLPSETVRYRSLTLSRFGLTADRQMPVHFEAHDPNGAVVPKSARDVVTEYGLASGEFALPMDLAAGQYTLVVRSRNEAFPPEERQFLVPSVRSRSREGKAPAEPQNGLSGSFALSPKKSPAAKPGKVQVVFFPEGGELVGELENRVYFVARNSLGQPVQLSGRIISTGRGEGNREQELAQVQTMLDGMGSVSFTPRTGETYRLKVTSPPGVADEPTLPEVSSEGKVVLSAGAGVFAADKPLEVNVRAAKAGLPLVVAAYCRGVQVGEQPLVTKSDAAGDNRVAVTLDNAACGVIRLIVYDYNTTPPKPTAERLVYRRPARQLNVRIAGLKEWYAPGEKADLTLSATNEKGEPVPAALGVAVRYAGLSQLAGPDAAAMPTRFLLTSQIEGLDDLKNANFYLSDKTSDKTPAAVALDLLLGTRGWPWLAVKPLSRNAIPGLPALSSDPPLMFDNLHQIRSNYEKSLAEYQADRTEALNTLTTASFFGGLGLVVMVAMLGLMRIVSGMHLWIAAIGATTCCLIIGAILMDPGRLETGQDLAVGFSSYPARSGASERSSESQALGVQRAGERTDEIGGLRSAKIIVPPGKRADFAETLFWAPLLMAGPDGKASISFTLPDAAGEFRVTVDAHGDGRIGFGRAEIVVRGAP